MSDKLSILKKLLSIDDSYLVQRGLNPEDALLDEPDINIDKTDKLFIERNLERKIEKPTDFIVKPVIEEKDDYIHINDNLPNIPFSMINAGARGSGKSVWTIFLMEKLNSYFDNIIIFSPTIELDHKYKMFFEKIDRDFEFGINIFTDYSESILSKILDKIKRFNKNKPFSDKSRTLMVFDDIICSLPKQQKKTKFNKLLLNNRHYNISIIVNSQSLKLFDSNLRKNCSQICLWRTWNILELRNYMEEFSALLGSSTTERQENFLKIYYYATADDHSFLYINTHNSPNIFFKNLDELINVPSIVSQPMDKYLPDILRNGGEVKKVCPKGKAICDCPEKDLVIKDKEDE